MAHPKRVVAIYSGGMDSTVMLYWLRARGYEVLPLGINYGQRHKRELEAAKEICLRLGYDYKVADLSAIRPFLAGSSQTDDSVAVPHGHYAEESMKKTVVPNRNMIMLSVAIARAISAEAGAVAYGAHAGDHAIYPDCRPQFVRAMADVARLCDWHSVELLAPFICMTKAQIASEGDLLNVPFVRTWSCYEGGELHCGKCGTCVERKEAFDVAGVSDPTQYEGQAVA